MNPEYKNILITGGAGFIGTNFVYHYLESHPEASITVVDALTYAGNKESLKPILDKIHFIEENICNESAMDAIVEGRDAIVHFAAETHVDRSIDDPGPFLQTNIIGTEILARLALKHKVKRFHHISTDEVFGALKLDDKEIFSEDTPYNPHSPYSAAKASSDHIVRAYGDTYGLPYTISNCSNNYGPYQFPEKVIPLFITHAIDDKPLPIYGDGKAIRDYLHVVDHYSGIEKILHEGENASTFCIGGNEEKNSLEIAKVVLDALDKPNDMIEFVEDRKGHDRRYAIDSTKIKKDLGWAPERNFDEGIQETVQWYKDHESWWRPLQKKASWK